MKGFTIALSLVAAALTGALPAHAQTQDHSMEHSTMDHGKHGAMAATSAGRPGDPASVTRTLNVSALDTMRFAPGKLSVRAGETIRFVVTNNGRIQHDFTIGDQKMQAEHEQMMNKMPGMKHDEPNAVSIPPGETRSLLWQFDQPGVFEIGCHEPGHYPAGMRMAVEVS